MSSPWVAPARPHRRAGAHYTSTGELPLIPGIDGVGRRQDGTRIYFVAGDDALGSMAEQARHRRAPRGRPARRVDAALSPPR